MDNWVGAFAKCAVYGGWDFPGTQLILKGTGKCLENQAKPFYLQPLKDDLNELMQRYNGLRECAAACEPTDVNVKERLEALGKKLDATAVCFKVLLL